MGGLDEGGVRVVRRVARFIGGLQLFLEGGHRPRVLVLDRVLAGRVDDVVLEPAVVRVGTLNADHAASGPYFVGAVAIRGDEVHLFADDGVRE